MARSGCQRLMVSNTAGIMRAEVMVESSRGSRAPLEHLPSPSLQDTAAPLTGGVPHVHLYHLWHHSPEWNVSVCWQQCERESANETAHYCNVLFAPDMTCRGSKHCTTARIFLYYYWRAASASVLFLIQGKKIGNKMCFSEDMHAFFSLNKISLVFLSPVRMKRKFNPFPQSRAALLLLHNSLEGLNLYWWQITVLN